MCVRSKARRGLGGGSAEGALGRERRPLFGALLENRIQIRLSSMKTRGGESWTGAGTQARELGWPLHTKNPVNRTQVTTKCPGLPRTEYGPLESGRFCTGALGSFIL